MTAPEARLADAAETRERFAHHTVLDTRWMDNDVYGHVNNVAYYSFFDTTVTRWLIERGLLDPQTSDPIGLVVETQCRYVRPISFPDAVTVGLRVTRLGTSSVRYELALFRGDDVAPSAVGHFVHVYVDRATRAPTPIPQPLRQALQSLTMP